MICNHLCLVDYFKLKFALYRSLNALNSLHKTKSICVFFLFGILFSFYFNQNYFCANRRKVVGINSPKKIEKDDRREREKAVETTKLNFTKITH